MPSSVTVSLKQWLQIEHCPAAWRGFDLYLLRDEQVVFYVGQSHAAFERVWQHILQGFRGRSALGWFILCNWPASMKFTVELLRSADILAAHSISADQLEAENSLNLAERLLIEHCAPCLNEALNPHPTLLPAVYAPLTAKPICSRSLKKLIREAARSLDAEARRERAADIW